MAVKELQTRIALKYDSFANWADETKEGFGAKLVLLKGEIGICEISAAEQGSNVVPTVLFKVGDGKTIFKELPWASAKAADIYSWAKASDVELDQDKKQIIFRGGGDVVYGVRRDKVLTFNYATTADAEGIKARLAVVEGSLGLGGGESGESVADILEDITQRLIVIEGEGDGSVKKALTDAKAYTDQAVAAAKQEAINTAASTAQEKVNALANGQVEANRAAITDLGTTVANEKTARESADKDLNERLERVEAFFEGAAKDEGEGDKK